MEKSRWRPLIPRIGHPDVPVDRAPKRKRASIACNACREKKTKCDSENPTCSACLDRNSTCVYIQKDESDTSTIALRRQNANLKKRNDALEALFDHLRSLPGNRAHAILERLRTVSNADPISILDGVKSNPLSPQPSAQKAALGLLPQLQSGFELGLLARHPIAYPTLNPLEDYINPESIVTGTELPSIAPLRPENNTASQYFKAQLRALSIGFWSAVPVSDEFARDALSLYLEIDHPTIGTFDAQLFITDLLELRLDFCSPFLVSALLAYASQGYATKDVSASARSLEFEEEAERLLEVERTDSLTTLSGLALLSYSHGAHGRYSDGSRKYAEEALQMGIRMKLFGVPDTFPHHKLQSLSANHQRALVSTAWGGFNTVMLLSLFHVLPPTAYPPALPYPGSSRMTESDDVSEECSSSSSTHHSYDAMYASFCSLWTILSEVLFIYRSSERPGAATLAFAYSKYGRLLALADRLPNGMGRQEHASLCVLFFHIVYHTIVLEIFRPFLRYNRIRTANYSKTSVSSPETISAISIRQLKSLIVESMQHQSAKATVFWAGISLMQVANAVIRDLAGPDWRYYFLFCIRSFQLLFPAFAVLKGIVQGLLALAVECDAITSSEALLIIEEFSSGGDFHSAIIRPTGGFVVDFDMAVQNERGAAVGVWLDKFEEISVFSKFTNEIF